MTVTDIVEQGQEQTQAEQLEMEALSEGVKRRRSRAKKEAGEPEESVSAIEAPKAKPRPRGRPRKRPNPKELENEIQSLKAQVKRLQRKLVGYEDIFKGKGITLEDMKTATEALSRFPPPSASNSRIVLNELTEGQTQILNFMVAALSPMGGRPPTMREIQEEFGLASVNSVRHYMGQLEELGYVTHVANLDKGLVKATRVHSPGAKTKSAKYVPTFDSGGIRIWPRGAIMALPNVAVLCGHHHRRKKMSKTSSKLVAQKVRKYVIKDPEKAGWITDDAKFPPALVNSPHTGNIIAEFQGTFVIMRYQRHQNLGDAILPVRDVVAARVWPMVPHYHVYAVASAGAVMRIVTADYLRAAELYLRPEDPDDAVPGWLCTIGDHDVHSILKKHGVEALYPPLDPTRAAPESSAIRAEPKAVAKAPMAEADEASPA